jgi:hypothetical protein
VSPVTCGRVRRGYVRAGIGIQPKEAQMLYGGDGAKYVMADRMREAERARLAGQTRVARERRAKVRTVVSTLVSALAVPFRH